MMDLVTSSDRFADAAEMFRVAIEEGDPLQKEDALDELFRAYRRLSGEATSHGARLRFDEATPRALARHQVQADTAASAVLDLEVARVMANVAALAGELDVGADADMPDAIEAVTSTARAIGEPDRLESTRLAFDEPGRRSPPSLDLPSAKQSFQAEAEGAYAALFQHTARLLGTGVAAATAVDVSRLSRDVSAMLESLTLTPLGRIAAAVMASVRRALQKLESLITGEQLELAKDTLKEHLEELKEGAVKTVLARLHGRDAGLAEIRELLEGTTSSKDRIDDGREALAILSESAARALSHLGKTAQLLAALRKPLAAILQRIGGTLPVDAITASAHVMILSVGLIRSMDYADSLPLIRGSQGIRDIARGALGRS